MQSQPDVAIQTLILASWHAGCPRRRQRSSSILFWRQDTFLLLHTYVSESGFEYVVPPSIAGNPKALDIYEKRIEEIRETYSRLAEMVPKEDARYILPNACETKLVMTMNCRSLYNFFERRLCRRAQWEIRELAEAMLDCVREVAPSLFSWVGSPCEMRGYCPEGRMSCGKIKSVNR